jgi:hypothetical protein
MKAGLARAVVEDCFSKPNFRSFQSMASVCHAEHKRKLLIHLLLVAGHRRMVSTVLAYLWQKKETDLFGSPRVRYYRKISTNGRYRPINTAKSRVSLAPSRRRLSVLCPGLWPSGQVVVYNAFLCCAKLPPVWLGQAAQAARKMSGVKHRVW